MNSRGVTCSLTLRMIGKLKNDFNSLEACENENNKYSRFLSLSNSVFEKGSKLVRISRMKLY